MNKLKAYRDRHGISRRQMAKQLGVNENTVGRWETGARVPELLTALEIMRVTGGEVPVDSWIADKDHTA